MDHGAQLSAVGVSLYSTNPVWKFRQVSPDQFEWLPVRVQLLEELAEGASD